MRRNLLCKRGNEMSPRYVLIYICSNVLHNWEFWARWHLIQKTLCTVYLSACKTKFFHRKTLQCCSVTNYNNISSNDDIWPSTIDMFTLRCSSMAASIEEVWRQKARQNVGVLDWGARSNATLEIFGVIVYHCVHSCCTFSFTLVGGVM